MEAIKVEIRVLKYFVAVTEEGNVTNAARLLNITQPTLSRQIKALEDELGVELFVRGNKQITLTEDGVLLQQRAMEIIELADKTASEFTSQKEYVGGIVSIGTVESTAVPFIMEIMKDFSKLYPNVQFCIFSGYADDIKDKIDKGLADFGILVDPIEISKYDMLRLPYEDKMGIIIPHDHKLKDKSHVNIKEIIDEPLIIPRRAMIGGEVKSLIDPYANRTRIVAAYNILSNASIMVTNGAGIAIGLDGTMALKNNSYLKFIPLEPELKMNNMIVWKKSHVFTTAASLLLKMIREKYSIID